MFANKAEAEAQCVFIFVAVEMFVLKRFFSAGLLRFIFVGGWIFLSIHTNLFLKKPAQNPKEKNHFGTKKLLDETGETPRFFIETLKSSSYKSSRYKGCKVTLVALVNVMEKQYEWVMLSDQLSSQEDHYTYHPWDK